MNSKQHLGLFLFLFFLCTNAYSQTPDDFECAYDDPPLTLPLTGDVCSFNGRTHTPDGMLRILVVYAGFEGYEGEANNSSYPLSGWSNNNG